ncbi:hypothetical protein CASFOL_030546 [Castilleja foliolosa]|uniref:Uncharacterized protein n=1 Tax=Castilleja foliolosa TaxID=1961234 RepID=A0ABD3C918_9LAMI
MLHKPDEIQLFPHIARVIKGRRSIAAKLPLVLGTFIYMLARHFHWKAPLVDSYTETAPLVFGLRSVHFKGGTINVHVTEMVGTVRYFGRTGGDSVVPPPPPEYHPPLEGEDVERGSCSRPRAKASRRTIDDVLDKMDDMAKGNVERHGVVLEKFENLEKTLNGDLEEYRDEVLGFRNDVGENVELIEKFFDAVNGYRAEVKSLHEEVKENNKLLFAFLKESGKSGPVPHGSHSSAT